MPTKELAKNRTETLAQDYVHEALTMAVAIVAERIRCLPKADQDDLFKLAMELPKVETAEEFQSIQVAMREILEQSEGRMLAMDLEDRESTPGMKRWLEMVSERIRHYRKEAGLTQEELAEKSGLPQAHISRLENGKHSPSQVTLVRIAQALGRSVKDLDPTA